MESFKETVDRINDLKKKRRAIILAHNYQLPEIQDIADFVGDSLGLSQQAAKTDAEVIVFCGVDFMAETAALLSPDKKVLLPAPDAGCPLAETITPEELRAKKREHPEAAVVCYINSSAAVKAESDICCTSSNALRVVESLPQEEILFVPDANLGQWVASQTKKKIILWDGCCITHHRVKPEDVEQVRRSHPDGIVLVHPECRPEVAALADYVGSTEGILKFARQSPAKKFIIGTEMGILHRLQRENPDKTFYLLSPGLVCPNMKRTASLAMVEAVLRDMSNQVTVPEEIRDRALAAVERMLAVS
ncbi:MAG: quinolinate synthase NadA [Firmicutes bacterium]|mgnify:FL=1|jgi:quinolinate synthase|nr:quinolinate synthase NadA [Bacillota bacterium]